jgi:hypothetical protein
MQRQLLTLCSGVSLLLCVAVCVLWVRSYWFIDAFNRHRIGPGDPPSFVRRDALYTEAGGIGFNSLWHVDPAMQGWAWPRHDTPWRYVHERRVEGTPIRPKWSWLGFARFDWGNPPGTGLRGFRIPLWLLALLFGALATPWLMRASGRLRARGRRRSGLCAACGYDLRAHGGGERCPECGSMSRESPAGAA